jgi:SAM-dependent methyltransferase
MSRERNQKPREIWLRKTLAGLPPKTRILDAGAGELRYKEFCSQLDYVAQDFGKYDGQGDGTGNQTGSWDQSRLDLICDIVKIPEPDQSFDAIMCVEVFEHLPDPIGALKEFARLLRSGGKLIITAPFCSATHFAPYHFYSGFNRYFYEKHFADLGFKITDLQANGNFFDFIYQETSRIPAMTEKYLNRRLNLPEKIILKLSLAMIDRFSRFDQKSGEFINFGYQVLATKR